MGNFFKIKSKLVKGSSIHLAHPLLEIPKFEFNEMTNSPSVALSPKDAKTENFLINILPVAFGF